MLDRVIVRFKRASSKVQSLPSESLNLALTSLADADELQTLVCQANAEGKALAIEVFQNRNGQPIFINFKKENL
ncbi:MAG: hypothetical protein WBP71_11740 [Terracidiphilus sp.]